MDTMTLPDIDDTVLLAIVELRSHVARVRAECGEQAAAEWCRQLAELVA